MSILAELRDVHPRQERVRARLLRRGGEHDAARVGEAVERPRDPTSSPSSAGAAPRCTRAPASVGALDERSTRSLIARVPVAAARQRRGSAARRPRPARAREAGQRLTEPGEPRREPVEPRPRPGERPQREAEALARARRRPARPDPGAARAAARAAGSSPGRRRARAAERRGVRQRGSFSSPTRSGSSTAPIGPGVDVRVRAAARLPVDGADVQAGAAADAGEHRLVAAAAQARAAVVEDDDVALLGPVRSPAPRGPVSSVV